ncbi:MAG: HAMP domain-containing protein [Acidobacteria bacterium]|nr:HAMP domain-containing protein [Acidobacteriota bacterium]
MQLKSIQFRFALWAGICLLVSGALFIGYSAYSARTAAVAKAQEEAVGIVQTEAGRVRTELEYALNVTRTVAQTLTAAKEQKGLALTREGVNTIIKKVLTENPQFVAFYSDWEPNAFDGRDQEYGGKPGYNPDGRFNFTWSRGEDGVIRSDVTPPGDEEVSDWYQAPKRAMKEAIIEPYPYNVQGKEILETTVSVPIIVNGEFIGMVGADLKIDFLQKMADGISLYNGTGKLLLLSHKGIIAGATRQPELIKQPVNKAHPELSEMLPQIQAGQGQIAVAGDKLRVLIPLPVGQTGTPWAALMLIPTTAVTAEATRTMWGQLLTGLLLTALAMLLLWYLAGKVAAPIKAAARFAENLANGENVTKVPVTSADETGRLLTAMNSMLESANSLVQTREERDNLQRSIIKLLNEVGSVAEGDLTRRAEVTNDATGAIADSFNFMTGELRRIVGDVKQVATEVGSTANQTQHATRQLAEEARTRADQIIQASQDIDAMADSIQRVSETAATSKDVAHQSLATAKRGAEVLQHTVAGMSRLREQVQETAKRIKRLGEHSQEIGEIVQLINDIAYRTSVLALNASIQAARAGEAGRHSVVQGTTLIHEAGEALSEIESVSAQLAKLVQGISESAQQQTRESAAVSQRMVWISKATGETASGIKQSALWVDQLAALADDLNVSVASFKLQSSRPQSLAQVP